MKVFNAYAPFFRVNSVFWDPSVYGRYLTVAVLASLAGILLGGVRGWRVAGLYAVVVATWLGLLISFSQSSFVALAAGIVVAAAVVWGRRALVVLVALGLVTCAVLFAVPQLRDDLVGKSRSGVNRVTSGRANLVGQGVRIALDHPVTGVGAGGFSREYAHRRGITGKDPKRVASHTTPVTVAAEEGILGLALLVWLVAAALLATLRGLGSGFTSRVALATGIVLLAIARPQPLLRGLLRGSDDLGAARARRPERTCAEEAAARHGRARVGAAGAACPRAAPRGARRGLDSPRAHRCRTGARPRAPYR